ncbi:SAV_2336 N-terminal domain-related protein [Kitasatospora sp. MAP5-34]|uniref:SAV_2336 N-terminal domain-related protein n=1 Tax=Kitasatospora sp. MAP5-34 TaxID=3035102 RepID=UPI002476344B|nr:SAV_2336 N-terminal domain-related protein [Kitasatospora sp. MAP5-34]MDH6576170.1 MinD-like ATPase involved in chromosome partitioning or flagellar assembly [Kitasatospora sp. MAP5-34]
MGLQTALSRTLDVLAGAGIELAPEELLDALWLAGRLPAAEPEPEPAPALAPTAGAARPPADAAISTAAAETTSDDSSETPQSHALHEALDSGGPAGQSALAPPESRPRPEQSREQNQEQSRPQARQRAQAVRVPERRAFPDELALARALRPLKRHRASPWRTELDEAATAAEAAETGLPDAVLRPARERWLRCDLVVDDGVSMLLWRRTAADLRLLLERSGAFRQVRVLGLRARGAQPVRLSGTPYRYSADGDPALLDPATLADPTGQSLVLLLSDGAGSAWRDGRIKDVLDRWARCGPTAVVHTLPRRMWPGSGLPAEYWTVSTPRQGAANADWRVQDPFLPYGAPDRPGVPVPVLELTPAALRDWSGLLASSGGQARLALWEPRPALPRQAARRRPPADPDRAALARLDRFRAAASPEAYRLAGQLAAVAPVTVPVMRLVQATTPDAGDPVPLAEVFLGGLVRPVLGSGAGSGSGRQSAPAAHHRLFDFPEVVKDRLLDEVPTAELVEVGHQVSRQLESLAGRSPDFPAWLLGPATGPGAAAHADGLPFAWAAGPLLRRLGIAPTEEAAEEAREEPAEPWWRAAGRSQAWPPAASVLAERGRLRPLESDDPSEVGPYRVLGRLAPATENWLYAARKTGGELVAVRTAGPRPRSQRAWGLLADEVENLNNLAPRYSTPLITWDTRDSAGWLATAVPLTSGGTPAPTLREFVEVCGPLRPTRFLHHLALHLAVALRDSTGEGLLHGGLSPDRILITEHAPVLTGWQHRPGRWASLPSPDAASAAYRAPESGQLSQPADVFSIAAVLYYAWSGHEPDHRASDSLTLEGPADGRYPQPAWRMILVDCLSADPARRPGIETLVEVFGRTLAPGSEDAPLTAWMSHRGRDLLRTTAGQYTTRPGRTPGPVDPEPADGPPRLRAARVRVDAPPRPARNRHVTVLCPAVGVGLATTAAMLGAALVERNGAANREVVVLDSGRGADALAAWGQRKVPGGLWELVDSVSRLRRYGSSIDWHLERDSFAAGPGGVHLLAGERGELRPWGLTGDEYGEVLVQLERYFATLVTSVRAPTLDGHVRDVLRRTDQLVIVTGPQSGFVREAASLLGLIQEEGYRDLVRSSVVALSYDRPRRARGLSMVERLCREVVTIPYDEGLNWGDFVGLEELAPETWQTFRHLADLVSGD